MKKPQAQQAKTSVPSNSLHLDFLHCNQSFKTGLHLPNDLQAIMLDDYVELRIFTGTFGATSTRTYIRVQQQKMKAFKVVTTI